MIVVENRVIQDHFSMSRFCNVLGLKKGYIEMTEKIYIKTFEKCARSLTFPLLALRFKVPYSKHFKQT